MIDYRERRLRFWCQKVLPLVYDESLSYYELLCKIKKHLSEAETDVSALEQWLEELDAVAVKKVYSEYPLRAEKNGNTVTLKLRSHNVVTSVSAAEDSPIIVTGTGAQTTDHLDPDDDTSPMGTTSIVNNIILDVDNATSSKRGAMSATDKQKVDRLYNTFVEAGDNIIVSSTTASNGDTTYTVGVDPNFKAQIQNDDLMGDMWEWNTMLNGAANVNYIWREANNQWTIDSTGNPPTQWSPKVGNIMKGVFRRSDGYGVNDQCQITGFTVGSTISSPFTRVSVNTQCTDGEVLWTTLDSISVKGKFYGTGVGNKTVRIYLTGSSGSGNMQNNEYATHGDIFFPSYGLPYLPPHVDLTTNTNGEFEGTLPAGLECIGYTTSSAIPTNWTGVTGLRFTIYGTYADISSNVSVSDMKVSIKSNLQD